MSFSSIMTKQLTFLQSPYLDVLIMSFLAFLFKSMDPVLKHVQLTPEYHIYVINPVLWLLDMQHVQRILLGLTFLKHAHLLVSIFDIKFYIKSRSLGEFITSQDHSRLTKQHNLATVEKTILQDKNANI